MDNYPRFLTLGDNHRLPCVMNPIQDVLKPISNIGGPHTFHRNPILPQSNKSVNMANAFVVYIVNKTHIPERFKPVDLPVTSGDVRSETSATTKYTTSTTMETSTSWTLCVLPPTGARHVKFENFAQGRREVCPRGHKAEHRFVPPLFSKHPCTFNAEPCGKL